MRRNSSRRRVCFVTGTRAEFGLMRTVLKAIRKHPRLQLQLIVTGMHLDRAHGRSIDLIRKQGWKIDAVIPWNSSADAIATASQTGLAMARLATAFEKLNSDIVLITGDRVEPFAAASAAHVSQRVVAHVHGGDRAPGQIDDSLRHAIAKLAHVHFPATRSSAKRLLRLGEDSWRIYPTGSPGIDEIEKSAASWREVAKSCPKLKRGSFALLVLHPASPDARAEQAIAERVLSAVRSNGISQTVVIYPNNDPGGAGVILCWERRRDQITHLFKDLPRAIYLGLLRDAALLVGNSSSGIIEAASFGTPVVDIGPRQAGRDRSENVVSVPATNRAIASAVRKIWNAGRPGRWRGRNVYGGRGTGRRVAAILASLPLDARITRKLISY